MNLVFMILAGVLLAVLLAAFVLPRLRRSRVGEIPADILAKVSEITAGTRSTFGHGVYEMFGGVVIERLEKERDDQFAFIDRVTQEVEKADPKRDLSDTERKSIETAQARVVEIDEQLKPLRDFEKLRDVDDKAGRRYVPSRSAGEGDDLDDKRAGLGARVTEREHKYRTAGELLADAWKAGSRNQKVSREASDAAAERLRTLGFTVEGGTLVRAAAPHNTTAEIPGLMPELIIGEIMNNVDAARPFIGSIGARDLGNIPGSSFERPTITQHVQVAKQAAEKTEVANRQFKVAGVPFTKDVYGGWANVSKQSIDWSSPAMWDALLTDFIEQYGLETEEAAAGAFATAVVQEVELTESESIEDAELKELLKGLYRAAKLAYQGSGRLPDMIWASLDWWEVLGVVIDHLKATTAGDGGGDSSATTFAGNLLRTPRVIVPSFPDGTLIVGVKSRTEVYEDRYGFLSQVEPKVFGVEIAYGGEMASGTVKPAAFAKVVPFEGP